MMTTETTEDLEDEVVGSGGFLLRTLSSSAPSASEDTHGFGLAFVASEEEADLGPSRLTISQLLSLLGFGWFQGFLLLATGLVFASDAFELLVLSLVLSALPVALDDWLAAAVSSVSFLGLMIGSFCWGMLADRVGRRVSHISVSIALLGVGLLQLASINVALLLVFRFLTGFAVGGIHTGYTLFAEFLPTKSRSFWLNVFQSWFSLGAFYGALLAFLFLDQDGHGKWRLILILGTIPVWIAIALLPLVPSSVRFLGLKRRDVELKETFQQLAAWNRKPLPNVTVIVPTSNDELAMRVIFRPALLWTTIWLSLLWFCASLTYYGVVLFSPGFFRSLGLSPSVLTMITSIAEIPALVLGGLISGWFGRQKTIAGMFYLYAVALMGCWVCEWFLLPGWVVLLVSLIARGSASSAFAIIAMFTVELYPTKCRTSGFGWCNSASRVAGIVTPLIAMPLLSAVGSWLPISIYAISAAATATMTLLVFRTDTSRMDLADFTPKVK